MNCRPSSWALPNASQRCTWISAQSGLSAGSRASSSPVNGQVMVLRLSPSRSPTPEPSMVREGMKGMPMAPAR